MSKRALEADCPMSKLMHLLSGPWTIYILWILGKNGPTRFGSLKRQITGVSSKVLTERLRMLEDSGLIYREYEATIPPQVTYGITPRTLELTPVLDELAAIAQSWYGVDPCLPSLSSLRGSDDTTAKDASGNAASVPS
jgi:Predicted transcriptional regulators